MSKDCTHEQWTRTPWTSYSIFGVPYEMCTTCGKTWPRAKKPLTLGPSGDIPSNMQNGEIRKLPKANSPMWSEQWAYQGTAKSPYIVSAKKKAGNGITSGWDQTWGCSCPDWTKHSPRVDCKHILAVKLKEKIQVTPSDLMSGNMNPETKKEFEKFLAQKSKAVVQSGKSALEEKGRKFRTGI